MATQVLIPQNFALLLATKEIDFDNDVFKAILCTGTTFDVDTDLEYSDVSGTELATGNGYTAGGQTMTIPAITVDDTNNDARSEPSNVSYTASGGNIGPYQRVIIYDDTVTDDPIYVCIIYDAPRTITSGTTSDVLESALIRFKTPSSA